MRCGSLKVIKRQSLPPQIVPGPSMCGAAPDGLVSAAKIAPADSVSVRAATNLRLGEEGIGALLGLA